MLVMENLVADVPHDKNCDKKDIHFFYRRMFLATHDGRMEMYGQGDVPANGRPHHEYAVDLLKRALGDKEKKDIKYFFDVRSSEEYGYTAPEYIILKQLGLETTSPLGIKGMGEMAAIELFQYADILLEPKETALVLIAQLLYLYDDRMGRKGDAGVAFLLSKTDHSPQGLGVLGYKISENQILENDIGSMTQAVNDRNGIDYGCANEFLKLYDAISDRTLSGHLSPNIKGDKRRYTLNFKFMNYQGILELQSQEE